MREADIFHCNSYHEREVILKTNLEQFYQKWNKFELMMNWMIDWLYSVLRSIDNILAI